MAQLNNTSFFQPTGFALLILTHCIVFVSANSVARDHVHRKNAAASPDVGVDVWRRQQKGNGKMEKFELRNLETLTMINGKYNLKEVFIQPIMLSFIYLHIMKKKEGYLKKS